MRKFLHLFLTGITCLIFLLTYASASSQSAFRLEATLYHESFSQSAISPDRKLIVSGGNERTLKVWSYKTERLLRTIPTMISPPINITFVNDIEIVIAHQDGALTLWDLETGKKVQDLAIDNEPNKFAIITYNQKAGILLVTKPDGDENISQVWRYKDHRFLSSGLTVPASAYRAYPIDDDKLWLSPEGGRGISVFSLLKKKVIKRIATSKFNGVRFSNGGNCAVIENADSSLELWSTAEAKKVFALKSPVGFEVPSPSDDCNMLILTHTDATDSKQTEIWLWRRQFANQSTIISGFGSDFSYARFERGSSLVTIDTKYRIELFDVDKESVSRRSLLVAADAKTTHRENSTARHFLASNFLLDGHVNYNKYRTVKYEDYSNVIKNTNGYTSHSSSPYGNYGIFEDRERSVKDVWATGENYRKIASFKRQSHYQPDAFDPINQHILLSDADNNVILLNLSTGKFDVLERNFGMFGAAFSMDGALIMISSANNGQVRTYDSDSGAKLSVVDLGASAGRLSLSMSPDRQKAAIIGNPGFSGIFEISHLNKTAELRDLLPSLLRHSEFSSDGKYIRTGLENGIQVWNSIDGSLLFTQYYFPGGEWLTLTPEGFFDASENGSKYVNVVRALDAVPIDRSYEVLYRPDLVREKIEGDPNGKVREAAVYVNLEQIIKSGDAPSIEILGPNKVTSGVEEIKVRARIRDAGGGVGKIEWKANGITIGVDDFPLATAATDFIVERSIKLAAGNNAIQVKAFNSKRFLSSNSDLLSIIYVSQNSFTTPKLFVLSIGVNEYLDKRLELSYSVSDAKSIANAFKDAGSGIYDMIDVTTVVDSDVTASKLDKVFTDLGRRVSPSDVFILFMAGHGKTVDGKFNFLPHDFKYSGDKSFVDSGIGQDQLQKWFSQVSARKSIFLYDTCESGSMVERNSERTEVEQSTASSLLTRATGRTVLSASTDDAPALEGYKGHGVFSYAVLDAFSRADTNNDGVIDVKELAEYVGRVVPQVSYDAFKMRQMPQLRLQGANYSLTTRSEVDLSVGPYSPITASNVAKPTHIVVGSVQVRGAMRSTDPVLFEFGAGTRVVVTESIRGWSLIYREGKRLGFVPDASLARIQ